MPNFDLAKVFPYPSEQHRLHAYQHNDLLLNSNHYQAFAIQAEKGFTDRYAKLRYVIANFNSLVAKVSADLLFGEAIRINAEENQDWIESLMWNSGLNAQLWESAVSNAALGDAVLRVRTIDNEIRIEDVDPAIYFPHYDEKNPRRPLTKQELAWVVDLSEKGKAPDKYLIREIHTVGMVEMKTYKLKDSDSASGGMEIELEIPVADFNARAGTSYVPQVETGSTMMLLFHVPNTRLRGNKQFFGQSDFTPLESLQFALNNRLTKNDNILDKHSDPIVSVPEGILDEKGNVRKEALSMIEVPDGGQQPQYITWNANLDAAFKQIDKLVEFMFMVSETSPDILGLGNGGGQAESGRALKMRLIRSLAKANRKRRYYEHALKQAFWAAQEISRVKGYTVDNKRVTEVIDVSIDWQDGLVNDTLEQAQEAVLKVEGGLMSRKTAAMQLEGWDEERAQQEISDGVNRQIGSENLLTV